MSSITRLLISLSLLASVCAHADRVTMKNGDVISGKVVSLADGKVQIKSELLGSISGRLTDVARIRSEGVLYAVVGPELVPVANLEIEGAQAHIVTSDGHDVWVMLSDLQSMRSGEEQQEWERLHNAGFRDLWSGNLDAGLSAARSNASTTSLQVGIAAARTSLKDRIALTANSIYSQNRNSTGEIVATVFHTGIRYDRNLGNSIFTFGFVNADKDELQQLDLRKVFASGFGYRVSASPRLTLDAFSGASLNQESFAAVPRRTSGEMLMGQQLAYVPTPRIKFSETLSAFPNFTHIGEYRFAFDSSMIFGLNTWLALQTTLSNNFTTNPPVNSPGNNFLVSTGVRIKLGGSERTFTPHSRISGIQ